MNTSLEFTGYSMNVCRSAPVSPTHYSSGIYVPNDPVMKGKDEDNEKSGVISTTSPASRLLLHNARGIQSAPGSPQGK